ncbi:hypothetical protein [Flavobacterium difficile]|uniref:Cytochrome c domain-containing protein n=1 Tax=Flavobacterium difficile TaxID=2709659 RepID=A0ABX0I3G0_9FLAO|nr:hypothetical protein [Flavobacterium difficile]NHM01271.1 hypothetical protein [Flavobacterium difficile]
MKYLKFLPIFLLFSCSNNSEDDLTEPTSLAAITTYNNDVRAIINANCINCHGATPIPGTSLSLDTYVKVRDAVLNNNLLGRISLPEGNSLLMPQSGQRLPQNTIDKINDWNSDGLLE